MKIKKFNEAQQIQTDIRTLKHRIEGLESFKTQLTNENRKICMIGVGSKLSDSTRLPEEVIDGIVSLISESYAAQLAIKHLAFKNL